MKYDKLLEVENYIENLFVKKDMDLDNVIKSIKENKMPNHSIFPNQGKLIQLIINMCNVKSVLEIGTLAGYSAILMAKALPNSGRIKTIELEKDFANVAKKNIEKANLCNKIEVIEGEALEVLKNKVTDKTFDMFFFDAHKPSYIDYFNFAIKHSKKGSIIIADNVIRDGEVLDLNNLDEKVKGVREYNEYISNREDISTIIIPNVSGNGYDGMSLSFVK